MKQCEKCGILKYIVNHALKIEEECKKMNITLIRISTEDIKDHGEQ